MTTATMESISQTEAAKRLGISTTWLRELTSREVVSRNEDGSYPWPGVEADYQAFQDDAQEERSGGFGDAEYQEARARKTAMQARLAELDVQQREKILVHVDDVERMLRKPLERVDGILRSARNRYGPELAKAAGIELAEAKELIGRITESIREGLRDAS